MNHTVFVVNAGSSSIKYQLVNLADGSAMASGLVERIGFGGVGKLTHEVGGEKFPVEKEFHDHVEGLTSVLEAFAAHGPSLETAGIIAVGHRVVQGADDFDGPTLITPQVEERIEELIPWGPLHNPAHLQGIKAAKQAFPHLPQIAVFDTAFHSTLPPEAYTYALPVDIIRKYRLRRYGAHGTSHKYVSEKTAELLGRRPEDVNVIVLHLGNGASLCAVKAGKSVETSMGLTPLEGLVMGTRTGDIDPAAVFHLGRQAGLDVDALDTLFNKKSGMLGLAGSNDLRDVQTKADAGDEQAKLALEVYAHRIRGYVGNYYAQLGHVDAIAFTAGVGENDWQMRQRALRGLERLGIVVDPELNRTAKRGEPTRISPESGEVQVWVVPTNEEYEIARQCEAVVLGK